MNKSYLWLATAAACTQAAPVHAQEALGAPPTVEPEAAAPAAVEVDEDRGGGVDGFFALGPGVVPAFDGAKKYQLIPLLIANLGWRGVNLEVRGLGARLDLLGNSRVQVGPVVNFRGDRNSADDGSGRVKLLNDVDSSLEVGGYVGYRFGGDRYGQGEVAFDLSLAKDVTDGHDGVVGSAQVSYAAYRSQKFFLNVDAQTSFADKKYMRAFFGITPAEAVRSGLSAYRPDGGLRDIGAGLTAGYQFNERWGLIARAGATRYVGDAKDSPVVDEGSKTQAVGGLALSFRF
ncbi:Outer membrane scaffolding protein for murein synthesis, MipA/OmpV family [Sphingomonas guangdongensis]|uniref:Outer membrane scaffolding protein for murein synthesis, MipA/OmpV family n=1 Tax=Sphingomonas guangdongensis TaxID=1141890 RepID=A0A285QGA3_9SPHN|nr:MipA/OmpV family protein [Sphingomonas guangdongensis]SOB79102.1 Outer membrane scaffolding protein for murein synthesis, MipA/OmpV family [Sphingomonas guangdongensis]